jgi:Kef-type K+ transport system membrane component KefB
MHIPIDTPVFVLSLCLLIMLIVPPICRRIGMPSIFGLIVSGILIGPNGFKLIVGISELELLSTTGLLYLMFLMTLEIDMFSFRKNKFKSVWFGAFTFLIPFGLGFLLSYYVIFGNLVNHFYDEKNIIIASLLLACMFSTHTLVSYPITSRLNITKSEPVVVSIGGTIITDMAVLLFLTIITASNSSSLKVFFWEIKDIKLSSLLFWGITVVKLSTFMFVIFWALPKICRWYFSRFQSEDTAQYTFILCSLFLSGFFAHLTGIEPIVGAFMCGLVLNRIIPHRSVLMNRITFIGDSIFIPFFLIHIGMLVNIRVFFDGFDTLLLSVALILVALLSKYLAAVVTQKLYRYTRAEQLLLFGLSSSHAAATIAVIKV